MQKESCWLPFGVASFSENSGSSGDPLGGSAAQNIRSLNSEQCLKALPKGSLLHPVASLTLFISPEMSSWGRGKDKWTLLLVRNTHRRVVWPQSKKKGRNWLRLDMRSSSMSSDSLMFGDGLVQGCKNGTIRSLPKCHSHAGSTLPSAMKEMGMSMFSP